jgi:outer membrane protein assembly factor BamB
VRGFLSEISSMSGIFFFSVIALTPLWTANVGDLPDAGYSSPLVTEKCIYITGNEDGKHTIFCLNLDGKVLWRRQSGKGWTDQFAGSRSTPIIDGANLYDESPFGELVCLQAENGEMVWQRNLLDDYETPNLLYGRSGSLLIDDQHLFTQLGGEKGSMLCLDKTTGKTIYLAPSTGNAAGYGTPVMFQFENKPLIAAMDAKGVFVVNRQTGKLLFHIRHPARLDENISTPIYYDSKLFISNGAGSDSKLLQLHSDGDEVTAETVWTNKLLANAHGGVIMLDGLLYGATNKRGSGFACIRFDDGADMFLDRKITRGSFDFASGLFYILTEFGEIVIAKPQEKSFEVLARLQLPGAEGGQAYAHPVLKKNRFYVRIGGTLHCVRVD